MREIDHPPHAPSLLESMRSMGYSLEAALADIVDNSIAARARHVAIHFAAEPDPHLAILDDGKGMAAAELELAMRHGSTSPLVRRDDADLGRYGLGLKTASLSQARRLTVVSLKDKRISAYCWDLDHVRAKQSWTLLELEEAEIKRLPHVTTLLEQRAGTLVLWQELDRLAAGETSVSRALESQMTVAREHLSLVFHRYVAGESGLARLRVAINGLELEPVDPFLQENTATQRLAEDSFAVEGCRVSVKPFVLPHASKLSRRDIDRAGSSDGLRHQQGFYVYRNRRLIIWGTWFRLARKDELSKLARVRVDIPNALDHLWTIDVKKSTAVPPEAVRVNLRRTIERIRGASGRTLIFRGRQTNLGLVTPGWKEILDRDGVRYEINRDHPVLTACLSTLSVDQSKHVESVLRVMEQSFPVHAAYARLAADMKPKPSADDVEPSLRRTLDDILAGWDPSDPARSSFLDGLHLIEPFSTRPDLAQKIAKEKKAGL